MIVRKKSDFFNVFIQIGGKKCNFCEKTRVLQSFCKIHAKKFTFLGLLAKYFCLKFLSDLVNSVPVSCSIIALSALVRLIHFVSKSDVGELCEWIPKTLFTVLAFVRVGALGLHSTK
jgi:hypothetical protein